MPSRIPQVPADRPAARHAAGPENGRPGGNPAGPRETAHGGTPREAAHPGTLSAAAVAHPNIALAKYWGKRDSRLNLPATGSVSITLEGLHTRTEVIFDPNLATDELQLDGAPAQQRSGQLERVSRFLDIVRDLADTRLRARVATSNDFPTGAGLASSASGFAALAVAATSALGLALHPAELSALARRGSGSAARSIFGGYVEMLPGEQPDGSDAVARQLLTGTEWPLRVAIAVTTSAAKAVPSGVGMEASRRSSPFYSAWQTTAGIDATAARDAVTAKDFRRLGEIAERSCLAMHAVMLSTRPGLIYLSGPTVECLHRVRDLREREGRGVFFTVDAGPQVKAVCLPEDAPAVAAALREVPGVRRVLVTGLGDGATVSAGSQAAT